MHWSCWMLHSSIRTLASRSDNNLLQELRQPFPSVEQNCGELVLREYSSKVKPVRLMQLKKRLVKFAKVRLPKNRCSPMLRLIQ